MAEPVWAPDEAVAAARYQAGPPPSITLITIINNRSHEGAHSALMINASERVIFDPAGTWWHRTAPERNDVIHGVTPQMLNFYTDYHARESYHVVLQERRVSAELAERALRLVRDHGAVPKAMCANATSAVLRQLPGFESIAHSYFPGKVMARFAALPGVRTWRVRDNDADDNRSVLRGQERSR